jgi:hypothetical protein
MKAHLLNGVGNVSAREVEILESPGKAWVLSRAGNRRVGGGSKLRRCVDRCHRDLQAVMLSLSRISVAYLACERCMLEESWVTSMPRKY